MDVLAVLLSTRYPLPFAAATLAYLFLVAYLDVREREVYAWLYYFGVGVGALAVLLSIFGYGYDPVGVAVSLLVTMIFAGAMYVLYRAGLVGDGDPWLVLAVGLMNPYMIILDRFVLVPLIAMMLAGSVVVVAWVLWNIVGNLRRWDVFSRLTGSMDSGRRLLVLISGRVMRVEDFRKSRFYFPLVAEKGVRRAVAKVAWEPLSGEEYEVGGEYLIATYGFPFTVFLLFGAIVTYIALLYLMMVSEPGIPTCAVV